MQQNLEWPILRNLFPAWENREMTVYALTGARVRAIKWQKRIEESRGTAQPLKSAVAIIETRMAAYHAALQAATDRILATCLPTTTCTCGHHMSTHDSEGQACDLCACQKFWQAAMPGNSAMVETIKPREPNG